MERMMDGHNLSGVQAGDLIFVKPAGPQDWVGNLVARATGPGPYCHVRVVCAAPTEIAPGVVIEAMPQGILRTPLYASPDPADVAHIGHTFNLLRQTDALAWLRQQVGRPYGFLDIAADALGLFTPRWLGSRTPFLVAPSQQDCSHLAATFAVGAGYPLPLAMIADLPRVSPNALARALGLLK